MAICLTLGGITTEMAIEDLDTALTSLITSLLAQGVEGNIILDDVKKAVEKNELQLELLNLRTEEAYNTKLGEQDIT